MKTSLLLLFVLAAAPGQGRAVPALATQGQVSAKSAGVQADARADLVSALAKADIRIDLERRICSIPARILVRDELLEYLLVGLHGSAHESLFSTEIAPSLLNTALIALGVEPGQNASWEKLDPKPTREEIAAGAKVFDVTLPKGDGFYLYALWKEQDEVYFYRVEDLIRNLQTARTMRRHEWVYLGSRFAELEKGQPEQFVADREGNLINIAFFGEGNTLLTGSIESCLEQTVWIANSWMMPDRGWPVQFIFSREPVADPPLDWVRQLVEPGAKTASDAGKQSR